MGIRPQKVFFFNRDPVLTLIMVFALKKCFTGFGL